MFEKKAGTLVTPEKALFRNVLYDPDALWFMNMFGHVRVLVGFFQTLSMIPDEKMKE